MIIGALDQRHLEVWEELTDEKIPPLITDKMLAVTVMILVISLILGSLITGNFQFKIAAPLIVMIALALVAKLQLWRFISNFTEVGSIMIALTFVFISLFESTYVNIKTLENGEFSSSYYYEVKGDYCELNNLEFYMSNSRYTFLWDTEQKIFHVVPNPAFRYISAK